MKWNWKTFIIEVLRAIIAALSGAGAALFV